MQNSATKSIKGREMTREEMVNALFNRFYWADSDTDWSDRKVNEIKEHIADIDNALGRICRISFKANEQSRFYSWYKDLFAKVDQLIGPITDVRALLCEQLEHFQKESKRLLNKKETTQRAIESLCGAGNMSESEIVKFLNQDFKGAE